MKKYFTSESVTEGHPDKVCDQISDAILDEILRQDPTSRVACECTAATGLIYVMGEITTDCYVDIASVARKVIREIGYDRSQIGFDANTCAVLTGIHEQSADIAMGVDRSLEHKAGGEEYDLIGAGDQGMMFGYATNETEEYMPMALTLAHKLCRRLADVRKQGVLGYLCPDGKSQVTVEYDENNQIKRVDTVVVSTQHTSDVPMTMLRADIEREVIRAVIPSELLDENTKFFINPTGRFEIGGPAGDTGLTGRKIIVDTYGGKCPHGGGAFSGKDPTKVDRSAAYMARYICKNVVASGMADECTLEVAYAIGVAKPVSLYVDTHGTGKLSDDKIAEIIAKEFDLRPAAIIEKLGLRAPIYRNTAAYGHFGRPEFPWEQTDKVGDLQKYL